MVLAAIAAACGSVPDVHYVDNDGGTSGDGGFIADSGGRLDGASVDATASCSDLVPPGAICCGAKVCVNCAASDCAECTALTTCGGSLTDACCKRTAPQMQCRAASACK